MYIYIIKNNVIVHVYVHNKYYCYCNYIHVHILNRITCVCT